MKNQSRVFLVTVISFLVPVILFGGQQSLEGNSPKPFAKEIDGIGRLMTAIKTADGNYLTVSSTNLDGIIGSRVIEHTISKVSSSGRSLWKKSFIIKGDSPNAYYGHSEINAIAETKDGYILVGGNTLAEFTYALGTVMKLDKEGNLLWKKSISSSVGAHTIVFGSLVAHPDGSFTAVGTHEFGFSGFDWCPIVVKFNAAGDVLWKKVFYDAYGFFVSAPAADGGVVLGVYYGDGNSASLFKLDANGKKIWTRAFRMKGFNLYSIHATSDNGLLLLDGTSSTIVKVNEDGSFQWATKFGLSNSDPGTVAEFYRVSETPDQGYVLVGTLWKLDETSHWQSKRGIILKINNSRKIVFQKQFGPRESGIQGRNIFAPSPDGYTLFGTGWEKDNFLLLNIDSRGRVPGCNVVRSISFQQLTPPKAKNRTFELKNPKTITIQEHSFDLTEVEMTKSRKTICE